MRRYSRHRIHDRELERRHIEAIDEARENVRLARRDYHDALDELDELEDRDPESLFPPDQDYRPRRRGRGTRVVAEEINTEGRERPETPDDHQFGNLIVVGCKTAEEAAEFAPLPRLRCRSGRCALAPCPVPPDSLQLIYLVGSQIPTVTVLDREQRSAAWVNAGSGLVDLVRLLVVQPLAGTLVSFQRWLGAYSHRYRLTSRTRPCNSLTSLDRPGDLP